MAGRRQERALSGKPDDVHRTLFGGGFEEFPIFFEGGGDVEGGGVGVDLAEPGEAVALDAPVGGGEFRAEGAADAVGAFVTNGEHGGRRRVSGGKGGGEAVVGPDFLGDRNGKGLRGGHFGHGAGVVEAQVGKRAGEDAGGVADDEVVLA